MNLLEEMKKTCKNTSKLNLGIALLFGFLIMVFCVIFVHSYVHEMGHIAFGATSYLLFNPNGTISMNWSYMNFYGIMLPKTTHANWDPKGIAPLFGVGGFLGTALFLGIIYFLLPVFFKQLKEKRVKYWFKNGILLVFFYEFFSQLVIGYDGMFRSIANIFVIGMISDYIFWILIWIVFSLLIIELLKKDKT